MTLRTLALPILSVNVGLPAYLGRVRGEAVESGIAKRPVVAGTIRLEPTNLAGDGQADLSVHGGPDKAVYAYCATHWPAWQRELSLQAKPGTFGENLTLDGAGEEDIHIGDVFSWGAARLAVTQPRQPCFKLALHLGRADIGAAMIKSGRCGFYLRVIETGTVPVQDARLTRCTHEADAPSVRAIFAKYYDSKTPAAELRQLAATPGLSAEWHRALEAKATARG
jgi:MOSC domain-containing protein YiiM